MTDVVELRLVPNEQLERSEGQGRPRWRALGNDGNFDCQPAAGKTLHGGFYRLDLTLEKIEGELLNPMLYPDYGFGALEGTRVLLPAIAAGASHCVVRFLSDVRTLRFDPSVSACEFYMDGPRLQRIGKVSALTSMFSAVMAQTPGRRAKWALIAAAANRLLSSGPRGLGTWLYEAYAGAGEEEIPDAYADWLRLYEPRVQGPDAVRRIDALATRPRISLVMPVYNTDKKWLKACIDSVRAQNYPDWELCIADDASPLPHVREVLEEYTRRDARIKVVFRPQNGHISAASNSALELATGEFVALLDHDDELHPSALLRIAEAVNAHPEWRMLYSDEDKIDTRGRRYEPYFKPDFNYDLFLGQNCISHLGVYETALLREIGGFALGMEGSQDWDLALRCVERLSPGQVGHVPAVLYHWRAIPGSTALSGDQKSYAHDAGYKAVTAHLGRVSPGASVEPVQGLPGNYRVRYPVPATSPRVTLVVPTRDKVELLRMCVESILEKTDYDNFEILVVDNGSVEEATLGYFASLEGNPRVRVLPYPHPFNYSAINNFAVAHTDADIVGLVNNDIEAIGPGWLTEMVSHAIRPGVGCVGAMLYYPNDTVQHAGVITGFGGVAGHAHHGLNRGNMGYFGRLALAQDYTCVTAACLLVRRSIYEEVKGLDEGLKVAFNDVDFCLRVKAAGYRNVWTPFAELYHHESASRGLEDTPEKLARFQNEVNFMTARWGDSLHVDPAYNPNLSLATSPFALSFPPR